MDHPDEKPNFAPNAKPTALGVGRGGTLHRVRLLQCKSAQAEISQGQRGYPKHRKPSMPKMPWDKEPE